MRLPCASGAPNALAGAEHPADEGGGAVGDGAAVGVIVDNGVTVGARASWQTGSPSADGSSSKAPHRIAGRHPVNSFPRSDSFRFIMPPSDGGICPLNLLSARFSESMLTRLPTAAGIFPLRSFPLKSSDISLDISPISGGIAPIRLLFDRSSAVARESSSATTPRHLPIGLSDSQFSPFTQFAPFVALNSAIRAALSGDVGVGVDVGVCAETPPPADAAHSPITPSATAAAIVLVGRRAPIPAIAGGGRRARIRRAPSPPAASRRPPSPRRPPARSIARRPTPARPAADA